VKPLKIVVHKSFQDTPVQPKQNKTAMFSMQCPPSTESQNAKLKSPDKSGKTESDTTASKRSSSSATADRITPEGINSHTQLKVYLCKKYIKLFCFIATIL